MRKILLGTVGLAALLASPAMAADMRVPPPPPPVLYYDWSGAYGGFNVGGVWYDQNQHFPTPTAAPGLFLPSADFTNSGSDGILGFHVGTQWQWGFWVLGVEAALSGCFQECRAFSGVNTSPLFGPNQLAETKMTNLFTVGPRVGVAFDRWMWFVTGGWASANLKSEFCRVNGTGCDAIGSNGNGASRNSGWYAGGGFDYMVHKGSLVDVVLGVEYQHYDVNGQNAFCGLPGCGAATSADYDLSSKGDLVRARLTIKTQGFGWWGPSSY